MSGKDNFFKDTKSISGIWRIIKIKQENYFILIIMYDLLRWIFMLFSSRELFNLCIYNFFLFIFAISLLRVVEKYHDIIKTCYLQNMYRRQE